MESVDQQFRQQKENYEHMTEGELDKLAEGAYDLTDLAREALQAVIMERGFTVQLKLKPPVSLQAGPPEDDEGLINFQRPDNADHAWRWMKCLTAAGVPSYLGPDNVMHLEEFRGNFDGPVSLKIRDVDLKRAQAAVEQAYARAREDSSNEGKKSEEKKDNVRNIFSGISFPLTESVNQQFRHLKENYEHMVEGELYALAEAGYDLTDIAREALQAVITERGFTIRLKLEPPAPLQAEPPENDEGLMNFKWLGNAENAWRVMGALTAAGIPSYLGPDNVMHLEEFRGKFDGLVSLKIRDVDRDRAIAVWRVAAVALYNDEEEKAEEEKEYAILCPKCRSAKVVMEGRDTDMAEPSPRARFQWSCDACGHQWMDDGILQETAGGQSWPGEEFPWDKDSSEERDPK